MAVTSQGSTSRLCVKLHALWPVLLFVALVFTSGCSTPYMTDRNRDAVDILTTTLGYGAGAKARLGPAHAGLYVGKDKFGVRGGTYFPHIDTRPTTLESGLDIDLSLVSMEVFNPTNAVIPELRRKTFLGAGYLFVSLPFNPEELGIHYSWAYYTQMEMAVGLGCSIRLGINIGEFLDFALGWFGIDILDDDISVRDAPSQHDTGVKPSNSE